MVTMSGDFRFIAEANILRRVMEAFTAVNVDIAIRFTPRKLYVETVDEDHGLTAIVHLDHSWFQYYACTETRAFQVNTEEIITDLRWSSTPPPIGHVCIYKDERDRQRLPPPLEMVHFVESLGLGVNPVKTLFRGLSTAVLLSRDVRWPEEDDIKIHACKAEIHRADWMLILQNAICFNENVIMGIGYSKVTLAAGTVQYELQGGETVVRNRTCILRDVPQLYTTNEGLPSEWINTFRFNSSIQRPLMMAATIAESIVFHFTAKHRMTDSVRAPLLECIFGRGSATYCLVLENLHLVIDDDDDADADD